MGLIGHIPGVPQVLDRIGEWGENNYLVVLEFFQVPMDRDSAGYKLGKEIGCWVAPISSGKKGPQQLAKAVKYTPAEFTQKMSKLCQEAGMHISEPELAKAMGQAFEKELTTQTAFKKLAQEFEHQAQKKGVPKTAPSATKAEGSASSSLAKSKATLTIDFDKLLEAGRHQIKVVFQELVEVLQNIAIDLIRFFLNQMELRKKLTKWVKKFWKEF